MRRLAWTFAARIGDKCQIRLARPNYVCVSKLYGSTEKCAVILAINNCDYCRKQKINILEWILRQLVSVYLNVGTISVRVTLKLWRINIICILHEYFKKTIFSLLKGFFFVCDFQTKPKTHRKFHRRHSNQALTPASDCRRDISRRNHLHMLSMRMTLI